MVTRNHPVASRPVEPDKTQLRVLQQKGVKAAVRLETIFWSQLADFARDDKKSLSALVFQLLAEAGPVKNRTAYLRCYCLDRMRRKQPLSALLGPAFDMLAFVSACPTPIAIITSERKLVAFNPAFSDTLKRIQGSAGDRERAISLTFSEPLPKIQQHILEKPTEIRVYNLGLQAGAAPPRQFRARFALSEREKGMNSLIVIFLEG